MPKIVMHIDVYTNFFRVTQLEPNVAKHVLGYLKKLVQYDWIVDEYGDRVRAPARTFALANADRTVFHLHVNCLDDFIHTLDRETVYSRDQFQVTHHAPVQAVQLRCRFDPGWTPRDYQVPILSFLYHEDMDQEIQEKGVSRFVGIQTGKGKTSTAVNTICRVGYRCAIFVLARYVDKWKGDVQKLTSATDEDVFIIDSGKKLQQAIDLARLGEFHPDFVIISEETFRVYLNTYFEMGLRPGSVHPHEFFPMLGIGFRLFDEVHQSFHLCFRIDCVTHVAYSLALTATLKNIDPFMENMYQIAYPRRNRYQGFVYDQFVEVTSLHYNIARNSPMRHQLWRFERGNYNHIFFEQAIERHERTADSYHELVFEALESQYLRNYEPGDRAIVFCSSVSLCTNLRDAIRARFPKMSCEKFTQGDPYENLMEPDIRVATLSKGGTAHDIPKLTTAILTINVQSLQANEQSLGRLRPIEGRIVRFVYFICNQVRKHQDYDAVKKRQLRPIVKSIIDRESRIQLN